MSDKPSSAEREFEEIFQKTVLSKVGTFKRKCALMNIKKAVKKLPFSRDGLELKETDPSYNIRYRVVCRFWREASAQETEGLDQSNIDKLVEELMTKVLHGKEIFYAQQCNESSGKDYVESGVSCEENLEGIDHQSLRDSDGKKITGYVTFINANDAILHVKPVDEDELKVNETEVPFGFNFVHPGDQVTVVVGSLTTCGKDLAILQTSELSDGKKEHFIACFSEKLSEEKCDGFKLFHLFFRRCYGIWKFIKNDKSLKENNDLIYQVLKMCNLLSKNLHNKSFCEEFYADLSSSYIFVELLPTFIRKSVQDLNRDDVSDLLISTVQYFPQSAKSVLKTAYLLTCELIENASDTDEAKENGVWGLTLQNKLANILAEAVPAVHEIDTQHLPWFEQPAILTSKEIFTEHDINGLEAIKEKGSYESLDKYLETNYRLLREECFRNLYSGIQDYCKNSPKKCDSKMKMYRVRLMGILQTTREISVALTCELYGEEDTEESSLEKRNLLYGNLMCISLDKSFKSPIWALVGNSPDETQKEPNNVYIKLCSDRNKLKDVEVLMELHKLTEEGDFALMAESPTFFQAFGPSMDRLIEAKTLGMLMNSHCRFAINSFLGCKNVF